MNSPKQHILIVDEEARMRRIIRSCLEQQGYEVLEAIDHTTALNTVFQHDVDLIVMDLMEHAVTGIDLCRRIRKSKPIPIIILTALSEEHFRLCAFEAGVDDYMTKPFSSRELTHRIRAILRRATHFCEFPRNRTERQLIYPDILIDPDAYRVTVAGEDINLTPKEYKLLFILAQSPEKLFTREQLLREIWHYDPLDGDCRTVDTHIKRLRKKIRQKSPKAASIISTVWGNGYKIKVPSYEDHLREG
ncbi:response regulator transcription factor [Paenibacillus sp. GYB004]|uniref:response regulator transcription factor n=1 Tax=Paenibacillus sp. GYB004 TaxID=2994393 RepID=UPI002F963773